MMLHRLLMLLLLAHFSSLINVSNGLSLSHFVYKIAQRRSQQPLFGIIFNHKFHAASLSFLLCSSLDDEDKETGEAGGFDNNTNRKKEEDDDNDVGYDDDNENTIPYKNRSLAWTNRYRKLIPYEYARTTAMSLGLRSKQEWDEYIEDGKVYHGPYLVTRPDLMYIDDWESWEDFLGIMRSYEDARHIVQHVLQLHTLEEYKVFVSTDTKRAEGLRIPAKPEIFYKNCGWISEEHFFLRSC